MTGREMILYILANNLENESVIKDGKLVGFLTLDEVAVRLNVGAATVYAWITQKKLDYVIIGGQMFIPDNFKSPMDSVS